MTIVFVGIAVFLFCSAILLVVPFSPPLGPKSKTEISLNRIWNGVRFAITEGRWHPSEEIKIPTANGFNAEVTRKVFMEIYGLSPEQINKLAAVGRSDDGQILLLDAWGRPFVFQAPICYPSGLVYTTQQGPMVIRPLPNSIWPAEQVEVQIWSLGENGLDDRGAGDDVLPLFDASDLGTGVLVQGN